MNLSEVVEYNPICSEDLTYKTNFFEVKDLGNFIVVAEFNKGYSHIAVDDHCWVILNGGKISAWIFEEAMQVLKMLPDKPSAFKPYTDFLYKKTN